MGRIYYDGTEETVAQNKRIANAFMESFNALHYDDVDGQAALCRRYFARFGQESQLKKPFCCDQAVNISIGDGVFINYNCVFLDMTHITIGNRVLIGPNVTLSAAGHDKSHLNRGGGKCFASPIVIEDDVWIGANAVILPGVTLGKGCIVGAGAVVTKNVAPFSIVAGVPAKPIGESQ